MIAWKKDILLDMKAKQMYSRINALCNNNKKTDRTNEPVIYF